MSMIMEVFRKLRNCSMQLDKEEKVRILGKFVEKLHRSGYNKNARANIIKSGVTYFYRKMSIQLQGGPSVNMRSELHKG